MISNLILIYFGGPRHIVKTNFIIFQTVDLEICSILIKESGTSFSTVICAWFFKKNISHFMFYWQTKFHCLVAFTYWDIEQSMHCNYFCLVCYVINFEINISFLIKPFFYMTRKLGQKCKYLKKGKELLTWNKKKFFNIFKMLSLKQIKTTSSVVESPSSS